MNESAPINNRSIILTASQEEAVSCSDRYIAVIAGPGSGKTHVLTERVVRLIEECRIPSESILALSFSAKAANEVRKRLKEWLGYQALTVSVKTFHSFGLDIIRQNADLLGYRAAPDILNDTDKYRILRKILQEKQRDNQNISLANIQRYAQEISRIKGGISRCDMQISKEYHFSPSMSSPGCPYDNAAMENFFGTLKCECLYRAHCSNKTEVEQLVGEYVHFYNYERINLKDGLTPVEIRSKAA